MNDHNKKYGFYNFDLTQKRALELYSILIATILHNAWCEGGHPIHANAVRATREIIVPSLKKDKWTNDTIKERDYVFFLLGVILINSIDKEFRKWMVAFRKDTYENTLLFMIKEGKEFMADENAPLN